MAPLLGVVPENRKPKTEIDGGEAQAGTQVI